MTSTPDRRLVRARAWGREVTGWPDALLAPASTDASFRRYFRIEHDGQQRIIMDAPPDHEPLEPFVDVAGRLRRAGLHVPRILAENRVEGFLLLEDLGEQPWHRALRADNAETLFAQAIDALIRMQARTDARGLPNYDAAGLLRELALFPDWFLARHWRVQPTESELDVWDHVTTTLVRWALDQPRVFVHRDFMPRNLMVTDPNPGILDFQDAVLGPISYDPVCLFRDAFLSWPEPDVDRWLENYRRRGLKAGLPLPNDAGLWRRTCDLMGVQRHLKVIGIFARILYRDGKPQYLADAPRFFRYLDAAIARNPELAPLGALLATWRDRSLG